MFLQLQQYLMLGGIGLAIVLVFVITLALATIFLTFGVKLAGGEETAFGHTFVTALLMAIVAPIPCLGLPILQWYFIKTRHNLGWGGAIVAWIIAGLIPALIAIGILFLMGGLGSIMPSPSPPLITLLWL